MENLTEQEEKAIEPESKKTICEHVYAAVAQYSDNSVSLTVFEGNKSSTVVLSKAQSTQIAEQLTAYL